MAGSISLRATETSVNEQNTTIQIEVVRAGSLSGDVTINYGVDADTATFGLDYNSAGGQVVMPDGASSVFIPITILDDDIGESTEVLTVSLISVEGAELAAPRTNRISILDDETPAPPPPVEPPLISPYSVTLTTLIGGMNKPIKFLTAPNDANTLLIAEKGGTIITVNTVTNATGTLLDLSAMVNDIGDRGLLDIALHPDFASNPYLYAFYVVDPPETASAPPPSPSR